MKTKNVATRSPMQMTIVAFVLLFVAITATILVMYFKWFANDQLGAPAAVNVVVREQTQPEGQFSLNLTDDELFQNLYGYREWSQDKIDLIKINEGCQVLGSMLSNAGDQLVYFEKCGISSKLVLMDLSSKQEKLLYSKDVVNAGYNTFDYVPLKWSPQDKKIILQMVVGTVDLGPSYLEPIHKIIDVESAKDESLPSGNAFLGFVVGKDGEENLIYLSGMFNVVCDDLMGSFAKLIQRNSNNGKEFVLVENRNGIYVYLDDNGQIIVQEPVFPLDIPDVNCIEGLEMGSEQVVELK